MNATVTADFDTLVTTASPEARVEAPATTKVTSQLHPEVLGLTVGAYVAMITTFWVGFWAGDIVFTIAMGIVTLCLVAGVGLPYLMGRDKARFWARHGVTEKKAGTFRDFLNGQFETATGKVSGFGALVLVATVPICLTGGAIAMAMVLNTIK